MTEQPQTSPVPPYVSFQTLMNQIDRMATEGVPGRIDGTYLRGMSGGTQNQLKHAMRSLGLIEGPEDRPSKDLRLFVSNTNDRPHILANLLQQNFSRLVSLEQDATMGQLDDALSTYGLGTDTRRKAATFYLAAATFAGIQLSPQFKATKARKSSVGSVRKSVAKSKRTSDAAGTDPQPPAGNMVGSTSLLSGGTVTIIVDANLFDLSDEDQTFVTGLVNTLRRYRSDAMATSVDTSAEGQPGEDEV